MTASVTGKLKAQQGHETGPWEVKRGGYTGVDDLSVWPVGADGRGENRVACWINSEANARLIAAAPDLLAACEHLLFANKLFSEPDHKQNPDTEWEKAMDMAESAIASARNALRQEGA
jgi:hypothetical protein